LEDAVYTEVASRAFYVEDNATADKKTLERIELPNTIYKIGDYAFSNQSNLIDVSAIKYCLPYKEGNAEFDIKERAFRSCNKL
jgi:hypothetical protein